MRQIICGTISSAVQLLQSCGESKLDAVKRLRAVMKAFRLGWGKPNSFATIYSKDNLFVTAPVILFLSTVFGVLFYYIVDKWDFPTCFLFSISVLVGNMYLIPAERTRLSQNFTLCFYLWGVIIFTGAIATYADALVVAISRDSRRFKFGHWGHHNSHYIVLALGLIWIFVGVLYGLLYQEWTWEQSFYFAIAAMSSSGMSPRKIITRAIYITVSAILFLCNFLHFLYSCSDLHRQRPILVLYRSV